MHHTIGDTNLATLRRFNENRDAAIRLMEFDGVILRQTTSALNAAIQKINRFHSNKALTSELSNSLKNLENIHSNESLRKQYEMMNNQCLVLLVSYFTLAVETLFKDSLVSILSRLPSGALRMEPLKLTVEDLRQSSFDLKARIGDIIAKEISFQDMQSIGRAFHTYYTFAIAQDKDVNNIILAQACRHAIVHCGAVVNQRTIHQVARAVPRSVKMDVVVDSEIGFDRNEVRAVGELMYAYLNALGLQIETTISNQNEVVDYMPCPPGRAVTSETVGAADELPAEKSPILEMNR